MGDLVGSGPDPAETVDLVRERCALVLAGNHDAWVTRRTWFVWPGAEFDGRQFAREALDHDQLSWLRTLPAEQVRHGLYAVHAAPREPLWAFISNRGDAERAFARTPAVAFFGHTHVPVAWLRNSDAKVRRHEPHPGEPLLLGRYEQALINPGSVGRPQRNEDPRAFYLVLDATDGSVTWHAVEYEIDPAQDRMRRLGFSERIIAALAGKPRRGTRS